MEKQELFQIGDVAKLYHLSVGTLRHYDKTGLLRPEYVDPETGYRYYSTRQFECLNTIRYLRALDMPLPQIAAFLQNRDVDSIQELLVQQKKAIIQKQKDLLIIERKINNRLNQLQDALSTQFDTIRIMQTKPQRMAWIRNKLSPLSYLDLEESIRQLEGKENNGIVFLGKVGVGISRERLEKHLYNEYDLVFLILDEEDSYSGKTLELPEETCLSVRFCGSHKEAGVYYQQLNDYISHHHLAISGFSREITMIDYGITNDTSQFVTEIQIPILPSKV